MRVDSAVCLSVMEIRQWLNIDPNGLVLGVLVFVKGDEGRRNDSDAVRYSRV
jgi:hypothetical protein